MEYFISLFILASINVILATSFNLILGYGGLLSVAQPIFFAIGAYCSALIAIYFDIPIFLSIIFASFIAGVFAFGVSLPSLRVSGDYLVVSTLGFQLGTLHIINNIEITGAAGGLSNIPPLISHPYRSLLTLLIVVCFAVLSIWMVRKIMRSAYGRAITALRNDEIAFSSLGRNPIRIKVLIVALSAAMAGFAGGIYSHYYLYVTPEQFGIFATATLLTMVVIGGAGTVLGPAFGAIIITTLPEIITFLNLPVSIMAPLQGVIFTGLVLIFIFVKPSGLIGSTRGLDGLEIWKK
ncbi:MAG: branched-chain amino acid ABC transporter permease [Candidatus Endolissoclinum sp. TMED37]|nr:MAG: branched-chain amino acid ABC transporter permease [Candidatus Endolissoclinum sp. TMED37]|tara:strand:- start:299 stop:1180 length:882 start_codon:yes stop_codon:yes gene_type:complete